MIKIKSPVTWIGNKTSILHILYALFPIGYDRYVEPFGGSGAVLLGKPVPDKFEVFNDYNHNLVNLFRCMRDRPMEFIRELGFLSLNSRDDFAVLKKFFEKEEFTEDYLKAQLDLTEIMLPEVTAKEVRTLYSAARNDHDLRRAAMFLKFIRYSYSSGCKSFACQPFSLRTLFTLVQDFAKRCENVVIENQDFETLIKHYDRPTTFTYCDPPYFTSEYVYDCGFTWEDHLRLYHALAGMKGKFLLSYNDCPEIRELYKEYNFFDFKRVHSMAQKYEAGKEFPELLIANYDLFERERQQPHQLTLFDSIDKPLDYEKILKENIVYVHAKCAISLSSGNGGTVRGTGSYSYGSTVTISAIPNEGYMFEGWYENGRCLDNISDEYTFTAFANRTIEAKFVPNDLTISNVEVIGDKEPEETLIFSAKAEGGCRPYVWEYTIYKGDTLYYTLSGSTFDYLEWSPTETGNYTIVVCVIDKTGFKATYSKQFSII